VPPKVLSGCHIAGGGENNERPKKRGAEERATISLLKKRRGCATAPEEKDIRDAITGKKSLF